MIDMTRLTALSLAVALVLSPLNAKAFEKGAAEKVLSGAVQLYIQPAFRKFQLATDALLQGSRSLCATPSEEGLKQLNGLFDATVAAWSRIEFIRVGPLLENNRLERLLFYPDRKSATVKQVQALIDSGDEAIAEPATLAGKSVAVQGLAAFELAYFGSYPESIIGAKNTLRCRYGVAVAENINSMAAEMAKEWDAPEGIAAQFSKPGTDNPLFRHEGEALTALLGLHVHAVETLRDQRIEAFYDGPDAKVHPKAALFRRTANTMPAITAEFIALKDLWTVSDMATLLDADIRSVSGSVLFDLNTLIKATSELAQPTEETLADPKYRARMDFLLLTSRDLLNRLNDEYGKAIGLGAGFSFSDGD